MPRARNIKPSIMDNEDLAELEPVARLLFIYLWMLADKEGRLEDRPKRIAAQALPYDRTVDVDALLDELHHYGFLIRYTAENIKCIQILNFAKHQHPHHKEKPSELPSPDLAEKSPVITGQGQGKPSNSIKNPSDSLIPDSLIPEETSENADAPPDTPKYSPEHLAVAEHMADRLTEAGVGKVPKDLGKWADVIRLACERDNRTPDQLREVFDWAHFDDFWRANILSASKLREKFDQLALQRQSKSRGAQGPPNTTRGRAITDDLTDTSWAH